MGRRIRHHINPFHSRVQVTPDLWMDKYAASPGLLGLDIGCGKGEFVAALAQLNPKRFYIGVEIRRRIADAYFPPFAEIPNLALLHGNINLSLPAMCTDMALDEVYINFPDPYSKKQRLKKRRVVTPQLVEGLHCSMKDGATVFVQTDDRGLFGDIATLLSPRFQGLSDLARPGEFENPMHALTEWEKECQRKGKPVYRGLFAKSSKSNSV